MNRPDARPCVRREHAGYPRPVSVSEHRRQHHRQQHREPPSHGSGPTPRARRSFRATCRRYTSAMLVAVGAAVGVVLLLLDVWWQLAAAVAAAFVFGATVARPWCTAGARA